MYVKTIKKLKFKNSLSKNKRLANALSDELALEVKMCMF